LGANRIADILIAEGVPCWTYVKRWSAGYISFLLRTRAVLGEFQPGTHPRGGIWMASGPAIPNYFPRIIDEALWAGSKYYGPSGSEEEKSRSENITATVVVPIGVISFSGFVGTNREIQWFFKASQNIGPT